MTTPARPAATAHDRALVSRVGEAWRQLRRGGSQNELRPLILGRWADVLDWGGLDTLDLLCAHDDLRMSELAEALRVDASTATRAVQRLIGGGLAERSHDPNDRRAVLVRATPAGLAAQAEIVENRRAAMARLVGVFDADELVTLANLMERLVAAVDELARSARQAKS